MPVRRIPRGPAREQDGGMPANELLHHLEELAAERASAALYGLDGDPSYMAELDEEIAETHAAYVGFAVTEIAVLRAELNGRLEG
jgi:hypothetical protein